MGYYRTAQICLNGHLTTVSVETSPGLTAKRCTQCGALTTTICPQCRTPIRGDYHVDGVFGFSDYTVPAYCHECGASYPWTEAKLDAARELIDLAEISDGEKESMKENLPDLVADTPRTKLAATKTAMFLRKVGELAGGALRDILVDVASETAKKTLFPNQ